MADAEVMDDDDENSRFPENDKYWWEVPDEVLDRCSAPFCFLDPEDFLYYLNDPERGGKIKDMLSHDQERTVVQFLNWVLNNENIEWINDYAGHAIDAVWKP